MKYFVLIPDGMADEPIAALDNKTPMQAAHKPTMDALAKKSIVGTVSNVPHGMVPESDTANMAILSFDPKVYSKGRSPLEAVSMGLIMQPDEVAFRCNLVSLSEDGEYEEKIMLETLNEQGYGHGGGDFGLINTLYSILSGEESCRTSLDSSIESHLMGICAEESRKKGGELVYIRKQA